MRENLTSGLKGGSWKRNSPVGHPRVPSRCAEKPHNGSIGTQPAGSNCHRASFLPDSAQAEELHAAIRHSQLEIIAGAAHLSNLDAPEVFTRRVEEFLDYV
jgi:pimeloyl-ACP methyl ester carboxylesterase